VKRSGREVMKGEMEGKWKIGGTMMSILAVFALALALTGSAAGVCITGDHNVITPGVSNSVLIGQKLDFTKVGFGHTIIGKSPDSVKGKVYGTTSNDYDTKSYFTEPGTYCVDINGNGKCDDNDTTILSVDNPKMEVSIKVGGKKVSSFAQNTAFTIDFSNNLNDSDSVNVRIKNPDGNILTSNPSNPAQKFENITVDTVEKPMSITTDDNWKVGKYVIWIETNSECAQGLDYRSNNYTFEILKPTISIKASKTTTVVNTDVTITVTGAYNHQIYLNTSVPEHTEFRYGYEDYTSHTQDVIVGGEMWGIKDTIDEDGVRKYVVRFDDTGTYTLEAKDTTVSPPLTATVDITVEEKKVEPDMPSTVMLGKKLTIRGHANTGTTVCVAINDIVPDGYAHLTISDGEFSKDIETGVNAPKNASALKTIGTVRFEFFIDVDCKNGMDTSKLTPDGTWTLLLMRGNLTAKLSSTKVALGDSFTVSGAAPGSKNVHIITITPRGAGGKGIKLNTGTNYTGITYDRSSVSTIDNSFSKKLDVREDADTGSYLVAVLSPGPDGTYSNTGKSDLIEALEWSYGDLSTKTQTDMLDILNDLVTGAGVDDLMWIGYITIESPYVRLNPIESVAVGEPLVVNGTTNREEEHPIVITVKGPVELTPQTAYVTNGTFSATFDTSNAVPGTYTVTADDGDGHTDIATVEILTAVPTPTPSPTPTVSPTPTPTPTPTPSPTVSPVATPTPTPTPSPSPSPTPGFEAIFAVAGLLAVTYFVLRRKK